jgi:glutathione synthase
MDAMGGESIFRITPDDSNRNSIIDQITLKGSKTIMAQRFIPEITEGDKRILLVNGDPIPYALARIPATGEFRGNLAAGGRGQGVPLSEQDRLICTEIKNSLVENGILFAGIDVIGDYLTEINITSPTCIRELDAQYNLNISGLLFDHIEKILN